VDCSNGLNQTNLSQCKESVAVNLNSEEENRIHSGPIVTTDDVLDYPFTVFIIYGPIAHNHPSDVVSSVSDCNDIFFWFKLVDLFAMRRHLTCPTVNTMLLESVLMSTHRDLVVVTSMVRLHGARDELSEISKWLCATPPRTKSHSTSATFWSRSISMILVPSSMRNLLFILLLATNHTLTYSGCTADSSSASARQRLFQPRFTNASLNAAPNLQLRDVDHSKFWPGRPGARARGAQIEMPKRCRSPRHTS
jgi:hypothetical protein